MSFLHDQLLAAVIQRRRVAEAAAKTPRTYGSTGFAVHNTPERILADCKRDRSVLDRHVETSDFGLGHCFWCSEDGPAPILVPWPCPEIRELAEEYGVES